MTDPHGAEFPTADVRPEPAGAARLRTHFWWLTLLCVGVAAALVVFSRPPPRREIRVQFEEGHGLEEGADLRHRGIRVGVVTSVKLTADGNAVEVVVDIEEHAAGLAREGSRFWIERPRLSLAGASGLETAVGPKWLGMLPGPAGGPARSSFEGVETPPAVAEAEAVEVTLRFEEGHGIAPGDPVKHRGVAVGEVIRVDLASDLAGVRVGVRLAASARLLARAGSRFWIERPRVGLGGVSGLDTLVGGRFIAVIPGPRSGPASGPSVVTFDGLDGPPALASRSEGGLEVVLESVERSGLSPGAPVTYRGIGIGQITSVGLGSDAAGVEARAYVQPEYRGLVRANSRFWSISGMEVSLGLTGLSVDVDSLEALAAGGVALATPTQFGAPVATGHRFVLAVSPEDEWSEWRPRIPVGNTLLPDGLALPRPHRVSLRWSERSFGFSRDRQRDGWVLPTRTSLVGLAELLQPVEGAEGGLTVLAVAGREVEVQAERVKVGGEVGSLTVDSVAGLDPLWPSTRWRRPEGPEDVLVVADPQEEPVPLSPGQLVEDAETSGWRVDASVPLAGGWHGAIVVARRDGAAIGFLVIDDGQARVAPLGEAGP